MITSLIALTVFADPTVIAVGNWVIAEKTTKGWRTPGKSLHGKKLTFKSWRDDHAEDDYLGDIEYDAGPPMPSVMLKDVENPGPDLLFVSGKPTFGSIVAIGKTNLEYQKIAAEYGKSKGAKKSAEMVQGAQVDLDNDGRKEVVMVISSGAEEAKKTSFCAIVVRQLVGSKVQTKTLEFEGKYGYMRGPFSARFFGSGDFDGDGKREFVYSISDPWGSIAKVAQFRNGKIRTLAETGMGE